MGAAWRAWVGAYGGMQGSKEGHVVEYGRTKRKECRVRCEGCVCVCVCRDDAASLLRDDAHEARSGMEMSWPAGGSRAPGSVVW